MSTVTDTVGVVNAIPACSCPAEIGSLGDLCPACLADYETWCDTEVSAAPVMSLRHWLGDQAAFYRSRAEGDEPDPHGVLEACAVALEGLYLEASQRGFTRPDQFRESDPTLGSGYPRGFRQTEAGCLMLDEVDRYTRLGTAAADLVREVFEQVMADFDSWGSLEYRHRLARIRQDRRQACQGR